MDILFWSGGKDAYLALQFYRKTHRNSTVKLLTTYNETNEIVPHQQISLEHIKKQASHLGLELIPVPLPPHCSNEIYINHVQKALSNESIEHLVFGDWYLKDIRHWREKVFGDMGYSCLFPIWEKDLHELLPVLVLQPVTVEISAVDEEFQELIRVGELFDQSFVLQLNHLSEDIDPMGEKGEFHTKVIFQEPDDDRVQ